MITQSFEIHAGKNTTLFCTSWQPESQTKAVVLFVHGLGEHLGRYEEMANKFIESGIAVFAFDHRGHGQSSGKKGHAVSIEQLVEDTEFALMKCRSIFLEIPIFIYGHSMGGQIVASFLKKVKSKEIAGAIISSAWFELASPPPAWLVKMINSLKKILPNQTLSNNLDANHISSVKDEVELYQKDDLVHDQISFSLFKTLYHNGILLSTQESDVKVPVLVCHGDQDKITSAKASEQYAMNLGENGSFKMWEGAFHEPHHDYEKEKVIQFYVDWVLEKISS